MCHPCCPNHCGRTFSTFCQRYVSKKILLILAAAFRNFRYHYNFKGYHYIDGLIYAIPRLLRLRTFSIHTLTTPPNGLIDALFQSPSVVELSFEETPLDFRLPRVTCESLHTLRFKDGRDLRVSGGPRFFIRSWRESPGRRKYEEMESERCQSDTAATTRILGRHSPFLRHLELTSGLTSVRHLATTTWPVLQTLILTGPCPSHREPILQIMQAMPALRDLQIMYAICPPRYISFCVCLPNSITEITTSSTLTLATCSPALQSMTLSNPHSADAVWRGIPPSLESLTLLSIYEWPHKTVGIDIAYATRIVRHVSTCGARLRELRIFVNSEPTVDLIDTIVRHFPALQILHVGMDVWPRGARQDINISLLVRNSNNIFSLK
jgi:hypothetical protein